MGLERRFKNLFLSLLKHQICSKTELKDVFLKLSKATNLKNPKLCPAKVFVRQNFDKEIPTPLYLALVQLNALKPFTDCEGMILGFVWDSSVCSQTVLPLPIIPEACKKSSTGLLDPKYSKTIKNSLKVLQNHKLFIINKLNKVHDINYANSLSKEGDIEWPLLDVLSKYKSDEIGLTFDFSHLYKKTFPEFSAKQIKNILIELPNSLYLELINRSFLLELKNKGWQIQFIKTMYNPTQNNVQYKMLLKIGVV